MSARGNALRAQAKALRAHADALDAEADAVDAPMAVAQPATWIPRRESPLPATTARRLVRDGIIRASKVGRVHLLHAGDVADWIAKQAVKTSAEKTPVRAELPSDPFERARALAKRRKAAA